MLLTSSWILDVTIFLVTGFFILHKYTSRKYKYWQQRGVYCPEPFPFVGNFKDVVFSGEDIALWIKGIYDSANQRVIGVYLFDEPYLVIKDPALVKSVMVKDFNSFVDRNIACPDNCKIYSNLLFMQKGAEWKAVRSKSSSVYSSAKAKGMLPLIIQSAEEMKRYLDINQNLNDVHDLIQRFTIDVISTFAFGINSHCFDANDSEFRKNGHEILSFTLRSAFAQLIFFFKPAWVKPMKLQFFKRSLFDYFCNVFLEVTKSRKDSERYDDLVDIMKDLLKRETLKAEDESDMGLVCGIALQFFLAGYGTTSVAISLTLYEMALNVDIQRRARNEIKDVIKTQGSLTYDAIQDLTYLEMCLNETLRKYPCSAFVDRQCCADFKIPDSDVVIEKGITVLIPFFGLYRDEKYYPEPNKYNPERFRTKADSSKRLPFMPFGLGPRSCIGERFGKIVSKMAVISILTNFEIVKCKETPEHIEFSNKSFINLVPKDNIPLRFIPIDSEN